MLSNIRRQHNVPILVLCVVVLFTAHQQTHASFQDELTHSMIGFDRLS